MTSPLVHLLAGHWFCWSILFQAAAANMDFLFICPFLLALLLSRGSFADLEKQRVDSGLEICILFCSLTLVSHKQPDLPVPAEAGGNSHAGKRSETTERGTGGGRERTQNCWAVASLLFCRRALAELLGLLTKCLAGCRSRGGFSGNAWRSPKHAAFPFCSSMLGTKHASQSALGSGVVSQAAEHICGSQCIRVTGWDDGRELLDLQLSISSVPWAFIAHEEVG